MFAKSTSFFCPNRGWGVMNSNTAKIRMMALMSMMLALMIILSFVESTLPPLVPVLPSMRLGLANVVSMYVLFFIGKRQAFALTGLKALFVLFTRGPMAGLLSAVGGLLALMVLVLLVIFVSKASYVMLSAAGAITHNFAQVIAASVILQTNIVVIYWPILMIGGVVIGFATGVLLRALTPYMDRVTSFYQKFN